MKRRVFPSPFAVALFASATVAPGTVVAQDLAGETDVTVASAVFDIRSAGVADLMATQTIARQNMSIPGGSLMSIIEATGNDTAGLIGLNQSSGDGGNQANFTAIALVPGDAIALIDLNARQELLSNTLISAAATDARIADSFNATMGGAQINQAAGSLNNQLNALAMAVSGVQDPATTALPGALLNDARLDQVGARDGGNTIDNTGDNRPPTVVDSFNGFRGTAQVSQVSGNLNQVANVAGISLRVGSSQ